MAKPCRVLLVDDHTRLRETLRTLLCSHDDIEIVGEAANGKEALEMIAANQPDVIVMDINMPVMNGIEAASMIRWTWSDSVIIGLCARSGCLRHPYVSKSRRCRGDLQRQN